MKKFLAAFGALALASCGTTAPAYAKPRVEVTISTGQPYYGYDNRGYGDYRRYDRRYNNDYGFYVKYFRNAPSYYSGRCNYRDVVVRDPYTGRLVCMKRHKYYRYMQERQYRYYR